MLHSIATNSLTRAKNDQRMLERKNSVWRLFFYLSSIKMIDWMWCDQICSNICLGEDDGPWLLCVEPTVTDNNGVGFSQPIQSHQLDERLLTKIFLSIWFCFSLSFTWNYFDFLQWCLIFKHANRLYFFCQMDVVFHSWTI